LAVPLLTACATTPAPRPETVPTSSPRLQHTPLSIVTLNIWNNQDDWPARLDFMVSTLRALNPDVICLQEVLQNPDLPNQAETIAGRLGYRYYFASVDSVGSAKRYGNAILTRHPVLAENYTKLEPLNDYRNAAHLRIRIGADSIDVYNTHLHHTPEGASIRRTQLLDLLEFIAATRARGPIVLAGDFNTPVTDEAVRMLDGVFADTYGLLHENAESVTTLNTAKGHRAVRIDHIFYQHGPSRALRPVTAEIILNQPNAAGLWASDHFGVMARFELAGW
jgi:endonuclease/exonuclease/phosphatase family metal-dependent hydrolase